MSQDGFNLMTMDVSRNKIKKLSSSSFLASLQHINLQRNEIQYIAANTFTQLVHLQTVRWLPFTELQKNINFLPKLNSVWLLYNYIIIIIIVATQMQGCKVKLKLEEKVLLAWEEDRRALVVIFWDVCCLQAQWQQAGDCPPALAGHPPLAGAGSPVLPGRQPTAVWLSHGLPRHHVGAHPDW